MQLIKVSTLSEATAAQVRAEYPNTSFPKDLTPECLEGLDYSFAEVDPAPEYDAETQRIEYEIVEVDGSYTGFVKQATVVQIPAEELNQRVQTWRENASVTMRQARIALFSSGQLSSVDSAIASMPDGQREVAEIEWAYGSTIERTSPLVVGLGPALGLDSVALDDLFKIAGTL